MFNSILNFAACEISLKRIFCPFDHKKMLPKVEIYKKHKWLVAQNTTCMEKIVEYYIFQPANVLKQWMLSKLFEDLLLTFLKIHIS